MQCRKNFALLFVRSTSVGIILSLARNCGQDKRLIFFDITSQIIHQIHNHHGELSAISSHCKPQHQSFLCQNMRDKHNNNTLDLQKHSPRIEYSITKNVSRAGKWQLYKIHDNARCTPSNANSIHRLTIQVIGDCYLEVESSVYDLLFWTSLRAEYAVSQWQWILRIDFLNQNILFPSSSFTICSDMNSAMMFVWMTSKENALLGCYNNFFAKWVL